MQNDRSSSTATTMEHLVGNHALVIRNLLASLGCHLGLDAHGGLKDQVLRLGPESRIPHNKSCSEKYQQEVRALLISPAKHVIIQECLIKSLRMSNYTL